MPVQVIDRPRTTGEKLAGAFSNVGEGLGQAVGAHYQAQEAKSRLAQENEQLKKLTGMDFSGINDPKMRQDALAQILQGQQKEKLMGSKQEFLSKLFGGNEPSNEMGEKLQSPGSAKGFDVSNISDEDIVRASSIDPNVGRAMQHAKDVALREKSEERKEKRREFESEREFGYKRAGKVLENVDKQRSMMPVKDAALASMEDAVVNGDQGFFSYDKLADLGLEMFRTAKGGQFKTAAKTFFVSNVGKFGGRPNMFIEQKIEEMLPKVGRSREANLASLELMKFENDVDKKHIETVDKLEELYMDKEGKLPSSFPKKVDELMKTYVEERQNQLALRLKELDREEKEGQKMGRKMVPKGTKLTIPDIDKYLDMAEGDADKALVMATEDGYEF